MSAPWDDDDAPLVFTSLFTLLARARLAIKTTMALGVASPCWGHPSPERGVVFTLFEVVFVAAAMSKLEASAVSKLAAPALYEAGEQPLP
ncbi:UNVERIFIED_CONTAM: hypothetical protein K2H54_032359 [Gekko kuhli]